MAGPAAAQQPKRGPQSVPTVRPLGNLPDLGNPDTGRALSYLRNRQGAANNNGVGRILPTLQNPALMQAANDNDGEEAPDVYGAAQRESEERMRALNAGYLGEEAGENQGEPYDDGGVGQDEGGAMFANGQDQAAIEQQRAAELARQQSMAANSARQQSAMQAAEEEGVQAQDAQTAAKRLAEQKAKNWLQAKFAASGFGVLFVLAWWNYEVFIKGGQPTWKILVVVLADMLSIISMIVSVLAPLLPIIMVLLAVGAAVPGPLQDLAVSIFGSLIGSQ